MKKSIAEVRAELSGCTVEMLRNIVRKDSTIKGVSRMCKAELVEAAVKVVSKLNPEVVEAVEAKAVPAVEIEDHEHRVAKVRAASTVEELEAVISEFTKAEMIYVFEDITCGTKTAKVSTPKDELVSQIARWIVEYREEEKFRALSLEEKYEYLTSRKDKHEVHQVFWWMTNGEFTEIARRVGVSPTDAYVVSKTLRALSGTADANKDAEAADAQVQEPEAEAKAQTKVTHSRYDFSACKDEEKLRKVLNKASKEIVLHIASTFEQIQIPDDGKGVTKEELVDAIVGLYFPKAPASPATTEAPTPQRPVRHTFTPGKRYFTCRFRHGVCIPERLFEVVHRTKNAVTVIELDVNDKDFVIAGPLTKPIHSEHGYEYFSPKKHERVCAYHRYDIEFCSDVDYDAAFDEAAYSPDYQENRAVLDDEPCESEPQATTKEEQTMRSTKLTVDEAVNALRTAETPNEMHEILTRCKKADMVSALSVLTDGAKYVNVAQSSNETARRVITELQDWREEEAFRALSYEEKYAALFDADGAKVRMYVQLMSDAELTETASRLEVQIPVNVGEYLPYPMNLETGVYRMIRVLQEVKEIERVCAPETADELKYRLNRASDIALAILVKKAGLEVEVHCSYYNTEAKDAIFKHYATEEHKGVYEPESCEEGYSDYAGDNASLEEDTETAEVAPAKDANKFVDIQADPADEAAYELTSVYYEPVTPKVLPVLSSKLREAIKSIKAASTRMAVYEELMRHTKSEIRELEEAITSVPADYPKSWSKEQIALYASHGIMHAREVAEYRARPYEERYAELLDARIGTSGDKLKMISIEELEETAYRLTGNKYLAYGEEYIRDRIEYELEKHARIQQVEDVAKAGDVSELKAALNEANIGVLRALVEKAGLSVHVYGGQAPKEINQPARDALLEYLMRWAVSF